MVVTRWRYVGEDAQWRVGAERGALAELPRVAQGERLSELAEELRSPYIDWIGELSVVNASPEWWASDLAAKNPFTWLYVRICALAAAREALAADAAAGTLVVCSTAALLAELQEAAAERGVPARVVWSPSAAAAAQPLAMRAAWAAVNAWGRFAPRPLRAGAQRLSPMARLALDRAPAHRRRTLQGLGAAREGGFAGDDTALLVTWVDARSVGSDGSYRDPHLGPLPQLLRERGLEVGLLPRVLPLADFADTARRLLGTGERLFFPDAWVTDADWRDCARRVRSFAPSLGADAAVAGVPVARLVDEHRVELERSHLDALGLAAGVRRLAEAGVRPGRIVFPWEGHGWEQALTDAAHRYMPGTRVIGYDNVNFSRFALSLYPAKAEIGLRPLPDRVVTNGPTFTRILVGEGYPADSVVTGCALRHADLLERPVAERAPGRDGPFRVLAATSIDPAQSIELIEKAITAFGGNERYEVEIKLHPAVDAARVRSQTRGVQAAGNARFVEEPIPALLGRADLMLYAYSVVCYEALAQGVPAVFVQAETFLDLDQLEPFPDLRRVARTPEQLRAHAEEVAGWSSDEHAAWTERARAAVREALAPLHPACVAAFLA